MSRHRVKSWQSAPYQSWDPWITDVEAPGVDRLPLARVDVGVGHFALGKRFDEASHSVEATPFCLAVSFLTSHTRPEALEGFDFGEVASSISLTSIVHPDSMHASVGIHRSLV
jgi:hypothetical protein